MSAALRPGPHPDKASGPAQGGAGASPMAVGGRWTAGMMTMPHHCRSAPLPSRPPRRPPPPIRPPSRSPRLISATVRPSPPGPTRPGARRARAAAGAGDPAVVRRPVRLLHRAVQPAIQADEPVVAAGLHRRRRCAGRLRAEAIGPFAVDLHEPAAEDCGPMAASLSRRVGLPAPSGNLMTYDATCTFRTYDAYGPRPLHLAPGQHLVRERLASVFGDERQVDVQVVDDMAAGAYIGIWIPAW